MEEQVNSNKQLRPHVLEPVRSVGTESVQRRELLH